LTLKIYFYPQSKTARASGMVEKRKAQSSNAADHFERVKPRF